MTPAHLGDAPYNPVFDRDMTQTITDIRKKQLELEIRTAYWKGWTDCCLGNEYKEPEVRLK